MLKTIAVDAVKISPNRQRQEFNEDAMRTLAESIQTNGLFHPICLRIEGDDFVLVSGERRLRAVTDIWAFGGTVRHGEYLLTSGTIPYVNLGDLDPLAREEAELDENLHRANLTWSELASATSRLRDLRTRQSEKGLREAPTTATIAQEIRGASTGRKLDETHKQLVVAKHLDDPDVASAKNLEDAFKAVKRREERTKNEQLAASVGAIFTAEVHRVYNEDSCEWLKKCSAERFDVVLTDPPYGMGADNFGDSGSSARTEHRYDDSREYFVKLMEAFCYHSFRVAKPQAHAYVFCDLDNFFDLRMWMDEAGWEVFRTPLIWHNTTGFRTPWVGYGPQRRYETILYAVKGKRPTDKVYPDIVTFPREQAPQHPAQKPVALLTELLSRSARPGDSVLDPFCGSGSIFPAAHELKVAATGIELDASYYGIAVGKVSKLKGE